MYNLPNRYHPRALAGVSFNCCCNFCAKSSGFLNLANKAWVCCSCNCFLLYPMNNDQPPKYQYVPIMVKIKIGNMVNNSVLLVCRARQIIITANVINPNKQIANTNSVI